MCSVLRFFFSSRRRHTRCALVTGVQTCALPIFRQVQASPWNRLSPHSDDVTGASAFAVRHVERQHRNWGEFKTPSLRSLQHTAPYMHNGSLATPAAVIRHYSEDRKRVV